MIFDPGIFVNTDHLIPKLWKLSYRLGTSSEPIRDSEKIDLRNNITKCDDILQSTEYLNHSMIEAPMIENDRNNQSDQSLTEDPSPTTPNTDYPETTPYTLRPYISRNCQHMGIYLSEVIANVTTNHRQLSQQKRSTLHQCVITNKDKKRFAKCRALTLGAITHIARGIVLGCQYLYKKGVNVLTKFNY